MLELTPFSVRTAWLQRKFLGSRELFDPGYCLNANDLLPRGSAVAVGSEFIPRETNVAWIIASVRELIPELIQSTFFSGVPHL